MAAMPDEFNFEAIRQEPWIPPRLSPGRRVVVSKLLSEASYRATFRGRKAYRLTMSYARWLNRSIQLNVEAVLHPPSGDAAWASKRKRLPK